MLTLPEARARILDRARPLPAEDAAYLDAVGRVLAEDVLAPRQHPLADNSAMDGYAMRAADLVGASSSTPVTLPIAGESAAGRAFTDPVPPGACVRISTGGNLPPGADAVVPQEDTAPANPGCVAFLAAPAPGAHIRRAGEEFAPGDVLLPAGARLGPAAIGLLATCGLTRVRVHRRPRVAILSTGDELVAPDRAGERPDVLVDSNGPLLLAACQRAGAVVTRLDQRPDDPGAVAAWLTDALSDADVVLTTGGASVGPHDVIASAWQAAGVETLFWKVAMKPGKPLRFGVPDANRDLVPDANRDLVPDANRDLVPDANRDLVPDAAGGAAPLVFALPGNPLAVLTGLELFVEPVLSVLSGGPADTRLRVRLPLAEARPGGGRLHLVRADFVDAPQGPCAFVPPRQGSNMLREAAVRPLTCVIPPGEALQAGTLVEAFAAPDALAGRAVTVD